MSQPPLLEIRDLHVAVDGKEILKGVSLTIHRGEIHALMGRNGSGKSTLAATLMGHPRYEVTRGEVLFEGRNLLEMEVDERARAGIFLAFQYPVAIPGVSVANFLRSALKSLRGEEMSAREFRTALKEEFKALHMPDSFGSRYVNEGFSGGEKKRLEIVQMGLIKPKLAILDETDSGLDIDGVRIVSENVNRIAGEDTGVLLITHYQRILRYIRPHFVHVMVGGRIIRSGDESLAHELEQRGYDWLLREAGVEEEKILQEVG
ncbi:MAG: ABC transporter ATP-binding protein [Armatimonadota bacterium]|nr:MAG: ABC transporter ATP-binding protein [Armatimonadota bacterium]